MSDIVKLVFLVMVMSNSASNTGSSLCVDEMFDLIFRDKSAIDYVVSGKTVPSRAECSVLCHQEEGCVSMAYSGSGECILHGELPQTLTVVSKQDTDIYYRKGAVPFSTTTPPTTTAATAQPTHTTTLTIMTKSEDVSSTVTVLAATPLTAIAGLTTMTTGSIATTPTPMATASTATTPTPMKTGSTATTPTPMATASTATTPTPMKTGSTATTPTPMTPASPATSPTPTTTAATSTASTSTITTTTTSTTTTTTTPTTTPTTTTPTTTTSLTTTTVATSQRVELWATAVLDYSSQDNVGDNNAASQVIGEPDVSAYGHNVKAWAQSNIYQLNYKQYVKLQYARKVYIKEVHVYETYRAGATWSVEVMKSSGAYYTIYHSNRLSRLQSIRIFKLALYNALSFTSDVIKIWVDPYYAGGAVEIDAVKVVGMTDPNQQ